MKTLNSIIAGLILISSVTSCESFSDHLKNEKKLDSIRMSDSLSMVYSVKQDSLDSIARLNTVIGVVVDYKYDSKSNTGDVLYFLRGDDEKLLRKCKIYDDSGYLKNAAVEVDYWINLPAKLVGDSVPLSFTGLGRHN